jgi:hypothetical protein
MLLCAVCTCRAVPRSGYQFGFGLGAKRHVKFRTLLIRGLRYKPIPFSCGLAGCET